MEHSAGQEPRTDQMRLTAAQIFSVAVRTGEDELKRSTAGLWLSGLAAGLGMGLTGLGAAAIFQAVRGQGEVGYLLSCLLYPLGFIVVILGRAQLFTENTLFPVVVVLDRRRHLYNTLRLWGVVFTANIVGALVFAVLVMRTSALSPALRSALSALGQHTTAGSFAGTFWAAVLGGWIIALMAWLVSAARFTLGQVILVYLMTLVVAAAHLAHCIAGSGEALAAVLAGHVSIGGYLQWLAAATIGNTVGGVFIVSLLNYGQVMGSGRDGENSARSLADVEQDSGWARPRRRTLHGRDTHR